MSHVYKVKYTLESGEFSRGDIDIKNQGLTDAVVVGSIIYPGDGSSSTGVATMDGRTGKPMEAIELWKFWTLLAHQLSEDTELDAGRRELCGTVHEIVKDFVLRARGLR